jgi:hypothetical protein
MWICSSPHKYPVPPNVLVSTGDLCLINYWTGDSNTVLLILLQKKSPRKDIKISVDLCFYFLFNVLQPIIAITLFWYSNYPNLATYINFMATPGSRHILVLVIFFGCLNYSMDFHFECILIFSMRNYLYNLRSWENYCSYDYEHWEMYLHSLPYFCLILSYHLIIC